MWKQIFELFTKVLTLTDRLDRIEKRIGEQQNEIKQLTELVNRVVFELARTNENVRHSQAREADAREKFQLQIENQLLKANRQLPPNPNDKPECQANADFVRWARFRRRQKNHVARWLQRGVDVD